MPLVCFPSASLFTFFHVSRGCSFWLLISCLNVKCAFLMSCCLFALSVTGDSFFAFSVTSMSSAQHRNRLLRLQRLLYPWLRVCGDWYSASSIAHRPSLMMLPNIHSWNSGLEVLRDLETYGISIPLISTSGAQYLWIGGQGILGLTTKYCTACHG